MVGMNRVKEGHLEAVCESDFQFKYVSDVFSDEIYCLYIITMFFNGVRKAT